MCIHTNGINLKIKKKLKTEAALGMMGNIFNVLGRQRHADLCEFKASLVYINESCASWGYLMRPASKLKQNPFPVAWRDTLPTLAESYKQCSPLKTNKEWLLIEDLRDMTSTTTNTSSSIL